MNIISKLKESGYKVHIVASGAGTLIQHELWKIPGASAWLSGASFPYDQAETEDFLGFKPDGFCTSETAVHLACAAYMKAFQFGSRAVGLGLTASVASLHEHRGDHRIHACVITPDRCLTMSRTINKGVGSERRSQDNDECSSIAFTLLSLVLGETNDDHFIEISDDYLLTHILSRPVFRESGQRTVTIPSHSAIFPGAYNPPHEGHFNIAETVTSLHGYRVVHQVTIDTPHKPKLTAQQVLERAKMLKGHDAVFTMGDPLYVQKSERFRCPLVMGADALRRMLDPKWGIDSNELINRFCAVKQPIFVNARKEGERIITLDDVLNEVGLGNKMGPTHAPGSFDNHTAHDLFVSIPGYWDISSTEIRNAVLHNR